MVCVLIGAILDCEKNKRCGVAIIIVKISDIYVATITWYTSVLETY